MPVREPCRAAGARRWGTESALLDDDEARRRLVAATVQCMLATGTARVTVGGVADEAGVSRSTVYRYFKNRDELILGVLLARIDAGMERIIGSLRRPNDAARSIAELVINAIGLVNGVEINEALFSSDSRLLVTSLQLASEPVIDAFHRHLRPLLERWQADAQLYADLDLRETTRWINAVALTLLAPPWRERSVAAKRAFLERYLVRALVQQ